VIRCRTSRTCCQGIGRGADTHDIESLDAPRSLGPVRAQALGLSIVDFLLEPADPKRAIPAGQYTFGPGDKIHGNIPKRYVEGPQICTQARRLTPRAYQVTLPGGDDGPWLAGMTLNPEDVYQAWCHRRRPPSGSRKSGTPLATPMPAPHRSTVRRRRRSPRRGGPSGLRRAARFDFRHLLVDKKMRPVSNERSGRPAGVRDIAFNRYLGKTEPP